MPLRNETPFEFVKETPTYKQYSRHLPTLKDVDNPNLYVSEDIMVFKDIVIYTQSEKTERLFPSGKKGIYFRPMAEMTYSARRYNREGEPMFRVFNPRGDFTRTKKHNPGDISNDEIARHVTELVERNYGIEVDPSWAKSHLFYQLLAYPMLRQWSLPKLEGGSEIHTALHTARDSSIDFGMPALSRGFLRSTPRAFIEQSFGKRFMRKDFIKAVAATESLERLAALATYRKHFGSDLGLTFLRTDGYTALEALLRNGRYKKELDYMLAPLTAAQRKRVLLSKHSGHAFIITDSMRIITNLMRNGNYEHERVDFRNWQTIHDTLSYIQRDQHAAMSETRVRRDKATVIEQKEHYIALDDTVVDFDGSQYSIQSAKNVNELRVWGSEMHNCIGGYDRAALKHESYLFGVYAGEKLLANMELTPKGEVVQLYGKHNRSLNAEVTKAITAHVESRTTALS